MDSRPLFEKQVLSLKISLPKDNKIKNHFFLIEISFWEFQMRLGNTQFIWYKGNAEIAKWKSILFIDFSSNADFAGELDC